MRILVAHNVRRSRTGGMSRMMGFIHDEVQRDGHQVEDVCADDLPPSLSGRAARFAFPLLVLERARAAERSGRPYDLINVHEPCSAAIGVAKRLAGSPHVVVTSHGVEQRAWELALEEARLGREGPSLRSRFVYPATSLWQSKLGLQRADHIFCLNSEDRRYLTDWLELPADRVSQICPAATGDFADAAAERSYEGAERVLFSGTWRKNKGIEDLVPAFRALAERLPRVELVVLGAGFPEAHVKAAFPPHLRDRVRCPTARSDREFAEVYASAHAFVLPSLFEGTPQTLIEAMASGLPIVTTRTCGMRDVIAHERNGLLVPIRAPEAVARALATILEDRGLRERLGRAARADALERYVWPKVALPVREVYQRLQAQKAKVSST